jgi:para-aminobenzoate synthetase component 1
MPKPDAAQFLDGPPSPLMVTIPYAGARPIQLYQKIMVENSPSFLFESGKGPSLIGRYSFFGVDPYQVLSGKDGAWVLRG